MSSNKSLESRVRGWFPQEPKIGIIQSSDFNMESGRWVPVPFLASGVLMIIAAVLSVYFGLTLLNNYEASLGLYHTPVDFASLYAGLLNLASFGLDLFAVVLLMLRKYVVLAEVLVSIVLACGLGAWWIFTYYYSPFVTIFYERFLLQGLFMVSPMIAFSLATLIIVRLNRKKLKQNNSMRWVALPFLASGVLMIIASIPFAINGFYLLQYITSARFTSASDTQIFYSSFEVLLNLLFFGLSLFLATLLIRRRGVGLAVVLTGAILVFGLPLQLISVGGYWPYPGLAFDSPTVACFIATLILVGLNYGKLKQDTDIKVQSELSTPKGEM